jgi:hypothetical protein
MTYLSKRTREIREEESVPAAVREDHRNRVTVRFIGKDIDPITAWQISKVWPWEEPVSYMGRAGG